MAKKEDKSLGRNCSFDENERAAIVMCIDNVVERGVKGWHWIESLKSAKAKVDFSKEELDVLKARAEKEARKAAPQLRAVAPKAPTPPKQ